jgi:succinate dehydrogenase/fumarate reductase cytochrome b subunit
MNVPKSVRTILKIIVQFVIVVLVLFGARYVVHQIGDYLGLSLPHNDNLMIVVSAIVVVVIANWRERH